MTSVSDPQLSPDGHHIAYVVTRVDEEANTFPHDSYAASERN